MKEPNKPSSITRKEIVFDPITDALAAIRNGECVVVVDDERRENEGDLICSAQFATPEQINFMATEARGLICLAMDGKRLDELDLPLMVDRNTDANETAFTVSIDAGPENGVSTGISAEDRARTIQVAINNSTKPSDLRRPGHIFPLRAKQGGVLKRAGHTEAAVDLSQLAGLVSSGVICEIQNNDGSMSRLPELYKFAKQWKLRLISIADLIKYRLANERFVSRQAITTLPSIFGEFKAIGYKNELDGTEHIAIIKGSPRELNEPVLVRMHSECLTGDAFGSLRCDCRPQLEAGLARIEQEGEGVLVYLRQEGRGIGLMNKLKAYSLQDEGLDTVEANERLGFPGDLRNYGVGAQILTDLGIHRLRLLTNNPRKIAGLGGYGLIVQERIPLVICPGEYNENYLAVKRDKLGHLFESTKETQEQKFSSKICILVAWEIDPEKCKLAYAREIAENIALQNNIEITTEHSTRLAALFKHPQFLWNVKSNDLNNKIKSNEVNLFTKHSIDLIYGLAKTGLSKSIGMLIAENHERALHPSTNIDFKVNNLVDLMGSNKKEIYINSNEYKIPLVTYWD